VEIYLKAAIAAIAQSDYTAAETETAA